MDKDYRQAFDSAIFQGLSEEEKQYLMQYANMRQVAVGELVVKQGEMGDRIYLILRGQLEVYRVIDDEDLPQRVVLAILNDGMTFGEASVMFQQPRSATVAALVDSTLLEIDGERLRTSTADLARAIYAKLIHNITLEFSKRVVYFGDRLMKVDAFQAERINRMDSDDALAMIEPSSILVLLGWRWRDIMHEVPFLSEHGYDAIKLSPPQEFVERSGCPWWAVYQPVSYHLSGYYGTEADFIKMVDFCHSYDLKIYADLVLNHMAEYPKDATDVWRGNNGTTFTRYHYGPLNAQQDYWEYADFYHYDDKQGNRQIDNEDYNNLDGVWHLEHYDFLNLPKLNLSHPHVIMVLRRYIKYLLRLGVDGFRIDAAKHLNIPAVREIFKGLRTNNGHRPFLYQEYYTGAPMGVDLYGFMEKYFKLGYVTSFKYGEFLAEVFTKRANSLEKLAAFSFGSSWIHFPSNRTVTVIDNHDTERMMSNMLNFNSTQYNAYVLAYIFMLAWPFGVPKIMSSFRFKAHDDGYPIKNVWDGDRDCGFEAGSGWVLQHRWVAIANMVLFHRLTSRAQGVAHIWAQGNQLAFARVQQEPGKSIVAIGFVVINATDEVLQRKFDTGLPDGIYYNLIASNLIGGKMHGDTVRVTDYGKAEIMIKPYDAVALVLDYRVS